MRIRTQFFLFSVLQSLVIFQYDPLLIVGHVNTHLRLELLAGVQLLVAASLVICSLVMARRFPPQQVVQIGLIFRIVATICLLTAKAPSWFIGGFLCYQLVALGLDTYYESSVMTWATQHQRSFGHFRLFGSLGYATSGLYVTGLLAVTGSLRSLLWFILCVNLVLLVLSSGHSELLVVTPRGINHGRESQMVWQSWVVLALGTAVITLPNSFGYLLTAYLRQGFHASLLQATAMGSVALLLGSCVSEMFGFYIVEALIIRLGATRVISLGVGLAVCRWFIAAIATSSRLFLATYLLHGVSFAFIYVGTVSWLVKVTGRVAGELATRFVLIANIIAIGLARLYPIMLAKWPIHTLFWGYLGFCLMTLGTFMIVLHRAPLRPLSSDK